MLGCVNVDRLDALKMADVVLGIGTTPAENAAEDRLGVDAHQQA